MKDLIKTIIHKLFVRNNKDNEKLTRYKLGISSFLLIILCLLLVVYGCIRYLDKKEVFLEKQIYELVEERFSNKKYAGYYQKGIQASKEYSEKWQTKSAIGLGIMDVETRKI